MKLWSGGESEEARRSHHRMLPDLVARFQSVISSCIGRHDERSPSTTTANLNPKEEAVSPRRAKGRGRGRAARRKATRFPLRLRP